MSAAIAAVERPVPAAAMKFQAETIAQCRFGIEALMEGHGLEFTYHKDIKGPVTPDWDLAVALERAGRLRILTSRNEAGQLVGYFFYSLTATPHYRNTLHAVEDTFFLLREYRGRNGFGLIRFVRYALDHMEHSGARVIVVTSKVKADLGFLWKRLGLEPEETRYTKAITTERKS